MNDHRKIQSSEYSGSATSPARRNYAPVVAGSIVVLVMFFLTAAPNYVSRETESGISGLPWVIRIASCVWCIILAKQLNRTVWAWALFSFLMPGIALIAIGLTERRRDHHDIPSSFEFEGPQVRQNVITKTTVDGTVLKIHSSIAVGFTKGDLVTINGEPAPSGKYKLGWQNYLTIEDGRISQL